MDFINNLWYLSAFWLGIATGWAIVKGLRLK